jgi:hypothetical protein
VLIQSENESYAPVRLRENEFESLIPRYVERLSNRWHWAPWKPLLDSPLGRVRPDAVMIARDLKSWCVIEVELSSHAESHFRGQFPLLEQAYYGTHLTDSITNAIPFVSKGEIDRLVRSEPPSLVCVADGMTDALRTACRDFGFELSVGTPLRSANGRYAIAWSRISRSLDKTPSHIEFPLMMNAGSWGGRLRAQLPRDFPNIDQITMRIGPLQHVVRVISQSNSRTVLLPVGTRAIRSRPLLLRPIDPVLGLYDLLNGEIDDD